MIMSSGFLPGTKSGNWNYVSSGTWEAAQEGAGLTEFMIITDKPSLRQIQILTMNHVYHRDENLMLGSTYPLGEPWVKGFFFFNDTATTEIYTLSLHDAPTSRSCS